MKALDQVSVRFEKGQSIALLGPNGAGKTTLIKCILGMVKPTSGSILFDNHNIFGKWAYRDRIGYMPQIGRYPDNMQVRQLFSLMKKIRQQHGKRQLDEELYEAFQLKEIEMRPLRTLSGGIDPEVLILDEPTAGLDPLSSERLKQKIAREKDKGKLILISSHILSDLNEIVTDVLFMNEGSIVFYKSLEEISRETQEESLSKAVVSIMKKETAKAPLTHA